ncbi:gamma-glutamyltransferase [Idiomarina xiamenensis]|uniref:Glutathione hydrolase proenzyme n=1 Tax=Idiomarina xiamenensis 10-D-4 TaxID=740709 RepID=K2L4K2_9GAMM|nr:gamma-glutamyltransferase [Idiomarina xiamenensis]EKE84750.1 gamma-glutamyltranspeptidase [Idiomarina xiamenensis 10-D-4]
MYKNLIALSLTLTATLTLTACGGAPQQREAREPEAATGVVDKQLVEGQHFMVAAATPLAANAGYHMLEQGGSAIDAAIAVQAMLTLTEPQSSGIGGGAFILYWDNNEKKLYSIDARERAPLAATPSLFLDSQGNAPRWIDAVVGGRSVGVPGVLRGLELAHQRWGKLDWQPLFAETIDKAEQGFKVSPRLAKLVELEINPGLRKMPTASDYFFPNGKPLQAGTLKKNPELADTLTRIAEQGADAFYQGELAQQLVSAVQQSPIAPGKLALQDLTQYQAKLREPVCQGYHQYQVCGMGPPSSGALTIGQLLGILEQTNIAEQQPNSAEAVHLFTQASRLAFADRDYYIADSDFVEVPSEAMLAPDYLASRASLITDNDMGSAEHGQPVAGEWGQDLAYELPNTSHVSIVDAEGNALSMTTSIEMGFGSTVMVNGFLLNNQLTDFSLQPRDQQGRLIANRVEAGKRPRSSMSPTIVLSEDGQRVVHVIGSPGGSRIIDYVAQTLVALLDWDMTMQQAVALPHVTNRNDYTALEQGTAITDVAEALKARGHEVKVMSLNSGLHGITVTAEGGLQGGADPRREGIAKGQ